MALQFACIVEVPRAGGGSGSGKKGKERGKEKGQGKGKKGKIGCGIEEEGEGRKGSARVVLEAVTRRESSLALFHLMGKVLYNKRQSPTFLSSATC